LGGAGQGHSEPGDLEQSASGAGINGFPDQVGAIAAQPRIDVVKVID